MISIRIKFTTDMDELVKMIPKYKKYEKEIYEKGIAASEIAYNVDLRRDINEERSNNLRTQIDKISNNDEFTNNEKKKKTIFYIITKSDNDY